MNTYIKQCGFTLIEGIITIVLLAIAMITLVSFLFPQVERSAVPHYQARSAAMADAIFNEILARQFDQHSDPNGDSVYRCDEKKAKDIFISSCTFATRLGPDDPLEAANPAMANDVDDFIGCWGDTTQCPNPYTYNGNNYVKPSLTSRRGELTDLVPSLSTANYTHIHATINVEYVPSQPLKKITVSVDAGRYGKYDYIAYRGNY
ncbi:type IV pilus modification PilV family protein [Photobacterium angustum]|uniref:type IV pilus modification PilV family protein n=1 Tax=Photobacterium angustum TaxID=661 RepID=UPI0005E1937E|nr:prepilin-type N-terminal cleavage/methylation domain-containing protein [Photobacterium angustum]KJG01153.1 pili assembly chaperone [Photobacterium angustum]KJG16660.1 pili assembly chaperone [Photobacterium angustum]KJG22930.1 pili assembly chaperone [Photobacterium angustum]KJG29899.1 pili assembly chaperone [Photobacterium angustum]PSV67597.1 pili assembly chaperone [Photobacterium angustum]